MKAKEHVKKFWKKNGAKMIYYGFGFTLGAVAMYKIRGIQLIPWSKSVAKNISEVLNYGKKGKYSVATIIGNTPIKVKDLGELGKRMIDMGANPECNTDRFIVIGDPIK